MFNSLKTIVTAAAVLAAVPAVASAQTVAFGNAPITVNSCNVTPSTDRLSFVGPISRGSELLRASNDIALDYVNDGNAAATSITFMIGTGNAAQRIVANGNFAPGAAVEQTYEVNDDRNLAAATCTVAEVRFADGNVWKAAPSVVSSR